MALYSDPTNDGRVQREAATLARAGYVVTVYALAMRDEHQVARTDGVEFVGVQPSASAVLPGTRNPFHAPEPGTSRPMSAGRLGWAVGYAANLRSWGRWATRAAGHPTIWHAHDFTGLLGLALGGVPRGIPIVYDSHELFMESGSAVRMPGPARGLLRWTERRLARRAAGVMTVNFGVAHELSRRYGVDPVVVMNCPQFEELDRPGRLRAALGLTDQQVVLYHGAVNPGRGIEIMMAALEHLPPSVVFVVLGSGSLEAYVRDQLQEPALSGRLYWHPAVPLSELLSWVVDADLGCALIAPTELSFLLSTPNKLFECMTAGVPIIASDFEEMQAIVLGRGVGAVCDPTDPRKVADRVRTMLADRDGLAAMRDAARQAARDTYNWDAQAARLVELYRRIAPVSGGRP